MPMAGLSSGSRITTGDQLWPSIQVFPSVLTGRWKLNSATASRPHPADQWQLFDFTGITPSGEFDAYVLPEIEGSGWNTSRLMSDGILSFINLLPGDANIDEVIDGSDAAILASNWQTASGATWAQGDFNKDGRVDEIDASLLAANWQHTSAPSASVPEPGGVVMLIMGVLACLVLKIPQKTL